MRRSFKSLWAEAALSQEKPNKSLVPPPRVVRHIQPIGPRVLVRVKRQEDVHESGLILPAGARDDLAEALFGEVIEVARAHGDSEEALGTNVSGVPNGALVLFPRDAGIRVPWDDDLRLIQVKRLLATVEEVPIDETH
jgi:co-chaperonin GroES (HSP10)